MPANMAVKTSKNGLTMTLFEAVFALLDCAESGQFLVFEFVNDQIVAHFIYLLFLLGIHSIFDSTQFIF